MTDTQLAAGDTGPGRRGGTRAGAPARLREHVAQVVADVLKVPVAVVAAAPSLFDLDGFDSLAIVDVLDRLEDDLAVEVPPECILPAAFSSVDALGELLSQAGPASSSHAGGPR